MKSMFSTSRLQLELISDKDQEFVFKLVNSEGWLQFIGDRNVRTLDDASAYIEKIRNTPDLYYWVVRIKEDQIPIGIISFLKRSYLEHFDLGFAFLPQFNGRGYAYEAAQEVLSHLRTNEDHSTILATTIPANSRSIGLLNRLGFNFEKELLVDGEALQIFSRQA